MLVDYHIHSEFSDDSRTPMESQIQRAIQLGVEEICFTDHVDYGVKKDWDQEDIQWRGGDGVGTAAQDLDPLTNVHYPEYFAKLYRMQKTYGSRITIRKGLEFGVQQHTIPLYRALLERYGSELDFVLLSVHQVENQEFWNGDFMRGRTRGEYNLRYYEEILKVVTDFDGYDVLAHLDLIARYDPLGSYPFEKIKDILAEIFQVIIPKGKGLEFNTSSWHYNLADTTPSREILRLYRDMGGKIVTLGSDAHTPQYLADHAQEAMRILKELGFAQLYTFSRHTPVPHPLP